MMNTVRDTFYSLGDRGGDIARSFGGGTAHLARRVGGGTASLARDIGPRRALIGLAAAAVAIGGSIMLVRYLRARRARTNGRGLIIEREDDLAIGRDASASERLGADARMSY